MIKKFLLSLMLSAPLFCLAQTEATLKKEFAKDVHDIVTPLRWDDKLNVIAINAEKNKFTVTAMDVDMNEAWTTDLDGYALSISKFKGKILVVAASDYIVSGINANIIYTGYLLEPISGKISVKKQLFNANPGIVESPYFFASPDGSYFKTVVRQTNLNPKKHWDNLIFPVSSYNTVKSINSEEETSAITVFDFDQQLNVSNTFHPVINNGVFISMACNNNGDLFIGWYRSGSINVIKYSAGEKVLNSQIKQNFDLAKVIDADFTLFSSAINHKVIYLVINYKNSDRDPELMISKLDFSDRSSSFITDTFDKNRITQIKEAYIPVNKKMSKPSELIGKYCSIKFIIEQNNRLMVFLAANYTRVFTANAEGTHMYETEGSMFINGYDLDLNFKFNQLFPSGYNIPLGLFYGEFMKPFINIKANSLTIIANTFGSDLLQGTLDVSTGAWNSMLFLPKKKINNIDYPLIDKMLWYPNGFILPYFRFTGFTKVKRGISLQQYTN